VLVDRYVRKYSNNTEYMDRDGQYGLKGTVDAAVLELLKLHAFTGDQQDYLTRSPPKSLDAWQLTLIPELDSLVLPDACATLEAFTAFCIVEGARLLQREVPKIWVLAGGGWHNPVITQKLKECLKEKIAPDIIVKKAEEIGWDGTYLEAEIFAYLAARSLHGLPISLPQTTKVDAPCCGGHAHLPQEGAVTSVVEVLLQQNPDILSGYQPMAYIK
jgi:anhydro-N-acetylmuramic acid kinase